MNPTRQLSQLDEINQLDHRHQMPEIRHDTSRQSAISEVAVSRLLNPSLLERPAFLLSYPFSYSTDVANNPWMQDLSDELRRPDFKRASIQFLELYRYLATEGLVYILPVPSNADLQDQVFTANLGIVLEHLPERNTVIISNFTSEPRRGETAVGAKFFRDIGYEVHVPPTKFEGEAELKHLYDNVYVGGYGIRSERETYDWMERLFGMHVVKVKLADPYLYHLDCTVFPITRENALVCTELFEKAEVAEIEKYTNVIDVSVDDCYAGICNSVRLTNTLLNASHVHDLRVGTEEYRQERHKNRTLEDIASDLGFALTLVNLSEYHKSGALLSCMVLHLNRYSYGFTLIA